MKTHQIPIEAFLAALKMMKVEDIDQVCSNLFFKSNSNKYYPPIRGFFGISTDVFIFLVYANAPKLIF